MCDPIRAVAPLWVHLLGHFAPSQDKLVAELTEAGLVATKSNPNPRPLEYAALGRLKYLNLFVRETMRLHPTGPMGSNRYSSRSITTYQ